MPNFEHVCEDCPLRTKVDIDRLGQSASIGTEGYIVVLSDGTDYQKIRVDDQELYDSTAASDSVAQFEARIEACEGPESTLFGLRKKCAAGLASAWRNDSLIGAEPLEPNVTSAADIEPLLRDATWRDAFNPMLRTGYYIGELENFSEYRNNGHSAFMPLAIRKLAQTVRGESTQIPEGKAVMLDQAYDLGENPTKRVSAKDMKCRYRLRIANGGPQYLFSLNDEEAEKHLSENFDAIMAEGIFRYINGDKHDVADAYVESERIEESTQRMLASLTNELFKKKR